ncbi:MAG: DinB family protein [Anaerolineaceae bacterium]
MTRLIERDELIRYVGGVHARTHEALIQLGDAALAWRPSPPEFSAGEVVLHIINTRLMNLEAIQQKPQRYRGHELPASTTAHDLQKLSLRSGKKVIAGLVDADFTVLVPNTTTGSSPAWQRVVGGLIEHEVHHRSQLCSYLTAMGIEAPPLYRLHAENLPK